MRVCFIAVVYSAAVSTGVAAQPTAQTSGAIPLTVEQVKVSEGHLQVTARNAGDRVITAWGMEASVWCADGTSERYQAFTDGYAAPLRSIQDTARLTAGSGHTLLFPIEVRTHKAIAKTAAQPLFAIFDDGTAVGDELLIAQVFQTRAMDMKVWQVFADTLARAQARGGDPLTILRSATADLDAIQDPVIHSAPAFHEASQRLASVIRRVSSDKATSSPADIDTLLGELRARRAAAEVHSHRR
jgi:hypothetical protein